MASVAELFEMAVRCQQGGDWQQAESLYGQIIRADTAAETGPHFPFHPGLARVHYNLGSVLHVQRRLSEAATSYRQAVRLDPSHAWARNNLGIVLKELGDLDQALESFREAARLRPDYADAHYNLGIVFMEHGPLSEAVLCFQEALRWNPKHTSARCNLGTALRRMGALEQARAEFTEVLCQEPGHAVAAWSQALLHLLQGNFPEGWKDYERRLDQPDYIRRSFTQPCWDGTPLKGKTILLYADGGLGDTFQFIRYAALVKERDGVVLVECQPQLKHLLASAPSVDFLCAKGDPLPPFEIQLPMMSLPRVFRAGDGRIPANVPYLQAERQRVAYWREQLCSLRGRKIGVAWQGNPHYGEDRFRSIPLEHFSALSRAGGVSLVSIQKGPGTEEISSQAERVPIHDLGSRLDETAAFVDTAAIMMNLDLVVTSDTSVAHLAGALGVRVWTLLSCVPEWRWLLERSDSPWYPTMRLFRQRRPGDWAEVFESVAAALFTPEPTATASVTSRPVSK